MVESGTEGDPGERAAQDAIAWFVRLNDPRASEADRRAFRAWIEADPEHERAMAETAALWGDLAAPAARLGHGGWYRERSPERQGFGRLAALAACAALLVAGAALWRDPGLVDRAFADQATRPGERRDVVLADGTRMLLDGDTALSAALSATRRDVTLIRGRVWFDVAPDKTRPFVVRSGALDAQALGTAFAVDHDVESVTVEEGQVEVLAGGEQVTLRAAERTALAAGGGLDAPSRIDPAAAAAWRRGLVAFDAAPLSEVAAELSRLEAGRVIIAGGDLRRLRLSGSFRADDPSGILEAMRGALSLKIVRLPGLVTLIYR